MIGGLAGTPSMEVENLRGFQIFTLLKLRKFWNDGEREKMCKCQLMITRVC